jgi:hypothetical protein
MEERFLALKIYADPIPQILRKTLANIEALHHERGSEIIPAKIDPLAKQDPPIDTKRSSRKM